MSRRRILCSSRLNGSRQRGQALAEFIAIAVAVVPLFLLIPLIAKYQDVSHATQMAARYVAFDSFVRNDSVSAWKTVDQLSAEIQRRFFGSADAPIKTNDVAGNFPAHQNLFWRGPTNEPLIKNFSTDVKVSFGPGNGAAHRDGLRAASDGLPMPLHPGLLLRADGTYTANVTVKLANMPAGLKFYEPFDKIDLSISRSTSVVYDPWSASGPKQVNERVAASAGIFPAGDLKEAGRLASAGILAVDWPGAIIGPQLGYLDFYIDVVPEDRLRIKNSGGFSGPGGRGPGGRGGLPQP